MLLVGMYVYSTLNYNEANPAKHLGAPGPVHRLTDAARRTEPYGTPVK